MARPSTLPGIMAPLAAILGVSHLAERLDASTRTLNNWATNASAMPAIEAGLLDELCHFHNIEEILYTHPKFAKMFVASTHEGWVVWNWAGYGLRRRYRGPLEGLVLAEEDMWRLASSHGWPHGWDDCHGVPVPSKRIPIAQAPPAPGPSLDFRDNFSSIRACVASMEAAISRKSSNYSISPPPPIN